MSDQTPPEVQPLSLKALVAIALGTFLIVFLLLEFVDPRWIGAFRGTVQPSAALPAGRAVSSPQATVQARRDTGQTGGAARATAGATPRGGLEKESAPPTQSGVGRAVIVETEGQGARLRSSPASQADVLGVVAEGTVVELTGQEAEADDYLWVEVRLPGGGSGWIAADFLAPVEPTPTP